MVWRYGLSQLVLAFFAKLDFYFGKQKLYINVV